MLRPILVPHQGNLVLAHLVNEDRTEVYFVRHLTVRGVTMCQLGLVPVENVTFLYGYSPTVDDFSVVQQMRK
ncbi:hypothetical protein MPK66_gp057 [Erwinia phage pEa_SNUABM_2]|uniref:Uncharacterized protein n=1 Tax=Erwinia phage pEa_SNUABM_2 TaxID=2869547 RepID=A0AAE7XMN0_9CAUD|nr:hypothetical protein MPK66_gp057 [Erwinia phage pEa_SNUABM_2]QZE59301.1 hypothetical protein pEaSNUABM2_00057 [Erwinia phage pEa_SNUABM_2]QZE59637.1 hypothetical protein pEaSNUABM39_00057 [Erwinia phage pEa_SNUABM_39]